MTIVLLNFAIPTEPFNSGRSQINFNAANGTGEYPFMNLMKVATPSVSGGQQTLTPDNCDSNLWPTSYPAGVTQVNYVINLPSQNERAGNYDLSWIGTGAASFTISGGMTVVSGSLTPSAGVGHAVVVPNNATAGPGPNDVNLSFNGPAQNVQLCHVNDLAALALNQNEFHPQFMSVLRALKPGVLRFLNWINGNQTGLTTWASRTPTSFSNFQGMPRVANLYAGKSTASGSDLSVGLPPGGFTLADKAQLQFYLSASPPNNGGGGFTATFTNGSANVGVPSHGLAVGNQVYLTGTAPTNFTATVFRTSTITLYFVKTVVDVNTVTLATTSGGTAISAGSGGSCNLNPYLTISVNGGAAIPIYNRFSVPYPQTFLVYPTGGNFQAYQIMVYDATFGAFVNFENGDGNCSVPPEVCLDLCSKIGAHPWFITPFMALDPATDWLTQLGSLIKNTYQNGSAPWMIPRFEVPNECWNPIGPNDTQYAIQKAIYYGWGTGFPGNCHNWVGKVASIGGQQLANVFGVGNLGTKYHWIVGVQTSGGNFSNSNDRLGSTAFLTIDPNAVQSPYTRTAASGWTSHICVANYFSPLERYTCQELIDAYSYSVTNAGNATAQAALANSYVDTLVSQQSTVTVTNGSANIVWTSHARLVNDQVVFMTVPPAGVAIGLTYFVKTVVDANTITLSATLGGTVITPTGNGSPTLAFSGNFNLANNFTLFVQWKAWAAGFGVNKMTFYEGGYSPDYLDGDWSTGITGATRNNPCVLTLAATSDNSENSGMSGNPAVIGMQVTLSSVGGMTQLNGNTYTVTGVSGNQVTINVDSSAFSVYTSGGTATYVSSKTYSNSLRGAGKSAPNLQTYLTQDYNNCILAGGEFSSCFQLGSAPPVPGSDVWSILDDIYQPFSTSAQALAIMAFNH